MKRIIRTALALLLLTALAGCGAAGAAAEIPPEEYEALHEKYMLYGTIMAYTWEDAEELSPEYFPDYYAFYYLHEGGSFQADEEHAMYIPQEDMEAMVQSRFDVTTEFLRSGSDYRPEKQAYEFYGIGSAAYTQITGAQQSGRTLTIHYDWFNPADELFAQGTLSIEVDGENFRYTANSVTQLEE